MAPITATAVGMTPQTIDDPQLKDLLKKLHSVPVQQGTDLPLDVDGFVAVLETCPTWRFEEQADLSEWIRPLNAIDACLASFLRNHPALLLVAPLSHHRNTAPEDDAMDISNPASSLEDIDSVPASVTDRLGSILRFLSCLLRNSTNKNIFNSVDEVVSLLAAANDTVASLAIHTLCSLACPPLLHKQQAPEVHQHSTALHLSKNGSHRRLLALAKGWGTRGSGLGLLRCATADDSEFGQGQLPHEAGQVNFEFFANDHGVVKLHLEASDILIKKETEDTTMDSAESSNKQKRRKTGSWLPERQTRSTAALFFQCLAQARDMPPDHLFPLLCEVRLARAFYSKETRVHAVERRLNALTAILHAHPSQEVMSGYFQAQPELTVELIDLLRPTVSSAAVSAASAVPVATNTEDIPAMSALAKSPEVPYGVRSLAVEALTALVGRRDGASGGLTGVARQSNVLSELGVGKGLYLGLLPTLIRYSLASLSAFLRNDDGDKSRTKKPKEDVPSSSVDVSLGMAFLKATKAPAIPIRDQLFLALDFIDSVLTLTSAVVSAPSGTAALTECGLVPALLSTVSSSMETFPLEQSLSPEDQAHARSLLRFITAQAVQVIEGATVTHNNALSAFHDLHGVEVLVSRLDSDICEIRRESERTSAVACAPGVESEPSTNNGDAMVVDEEVTPRSLTSSQRVLLFSVVNCLTVVFHQESNSSSTAASGGTQLRKPELTGALKEILENVTSYGGILASLTSTLLSDVMNSDPQVVHHVHRSGLAQSFLSMLSVTVGPDGERRTAIPPVPELIMAIPNVISALALTEDGANVIIDKNPFPPLLHLFYNPDYAMPNSRCLLNEMTAIVGTSFDEIMRHVPRLRPLVLSAVVEAMVNVANIGDRLMKREEEFDEILACERGEATALENERSSLIQYVLNFGQMLEQILHNEDHCEPFVRAGGLDATLNLFPLMIPSSSQFLAQASSLSCPSVCTLAHSTAEDSLMIAFKCIAMHFDSAKVLKKTAGLLEEQLHSLEVVQKALRETFPRDGCISDSELDAEGILGGVPLMPFHALVDDPTLRPKLGVLSKYYRTVVMQQWLTNLFSCAIRAASTLSQESGSDWGRKEKEWKKELSSEAFRKLMGRLSLFHESALLEACRVRTEEGYDERERRRLSTKLVGGKSVHYRLRIVCQEGAVVRDGTEIDSCTNIGSAEFGEILVAVDRCMNSSGVLRYRTKRGWVSELTRGHGREPIAEVLGVWTTAEDGIDSSTIVKGPKKRINFGPADARSVGASILARVQSSYNEVCSVLSRVVTQGIRALPTRTISFEEGTIGHHVASLSSTLSSSIQGSFGRAFPLKGRTSEIEIKGNGAAMYLALMLTNLGACLYEEKRERQALNLLLLESLAEADPFIQSRILKKTPEEAQPMSSDGINNMESRSFGLFGAIQFVLKQCLTDMVNQSSLESPDQSENKPPTQNVSRPVAASLPPILSLLKRIISNPVSKSSSVATILGRMKAEDFNTLIGKTSQSSVKGKMALPFEVETLAQTLQCGISAVVFEVWIDSRLEYVPAHLAHPITSLAGEIIAALDTTMKAASRPGATREQGGRWEIFSRSAARRDGTEGDTGDAAENNLPPVDQENDFEPSETIVSQLVEMGFSRDRALDALENVQSNSMEEAMEYALTHPPPSSATLERQRAERAERTRQRESGERPSGSIQNAAATDTSTGDSAAADGGPPAEEMDVDSTAPAGGATKPSRDEDDSKSRNAVLMAAAKQELRCWADQSPSVIFGLLAGTKTYTGKDSGSGFGNREALTTVACSFLVELCQRFPDERKNIVSGLLDKVKEEISTGNGSNAPLHGRSFAALVHATVLTVRAFPPSRLLVLEKNLVGCLVACLEALGPSTKPMDDKTCTILPTWLSPTLLLLDVMAQPVAAFADASKSATVSSGDGELQCVREEHQQQASLVADAARFLVGSQAVVDKGLNGASAGTTSAAGAKEKDTKAPPVENSSIPDNSFLSLPPFLPLLPKNAAERCMSVCVDLLRGERQESSSETLSYPSPGVAHAVFLLLARLVRSPRMASKCIRMGVAELILSLPRSCRFHGSSGLVAVILRHLLEDPGTLQTAMETEIRGVVTKLQTKESRRSSGSQSPVSVRSFVSAVTPLICRDTVIFFRAAATTVCIRSEKDKESVVALLSPAERSKARAAMAEEAIGSKKVVAPSKSNLPKDMRDSSNHSTKSPSKSKVGRNKQQHRGSRSRRSSHSKKNRLEGCRSLERKTALNGSPANHITCLVLGKVLSLSREDEDNLSCIPAKNPLSFGEDTAFLWVADLLEIMTDLVLAVPSCAAAIHKLRPASLKDISLTGSLSTQHALRGCPPPSATFVSFLIHDLLPQDRWNPKNDELWDRTSAGGDDDDAVKLKKKVSQRRLKVAQTSARLLVALVARAGEGRRCVLAALTFALSGGRLGQETSSKCASPQTTSGNEFEHYALQAWGDLCIGMAAPRSNGVNYDNNSSLSFAVVKTMLDLGMAHALMYAIHRVKLQHPMAVASCTSLLVPFEVFTRNGVTEAVQSIADKEAEAKSTKVDDSCDDVTARKTPKQKRTADISESQRSEGAFADDAMLEDGFDAETAARNVRHRVHDVDAYEEDPDEEIDESDEMSDEDESSDVEMEEVSEDGDSEEEDDDEMSSEEDGSDESSEGSSDGDSDEMADEEIIEDEVEESNGANDEEADTDDFFGYVGQEAESGGARQAEAELDEGWTRVEPGGLLIGRRNNLPSGGSNPLNLTARTRGFIDAAEAMIGSLLRSGEIQQGMIGEAVDPIFAEIEGTLGIRIMPPGRSDNGEEETPADRAARIRLSAGARASRPSGGQDAGEAMGALPHVQQRGAPNDGYASMGIGGRWSETSPMEIVFGGLHVGSREYDVVTPISHSQDESPPAQGHINLQLFPGGPAASTHARTQQSLHPLLCGIELPPMNSLVADLRSQDERASQQNESSRNRQGDLGFSSYAVSSPSGNIVRLDRGQNRVPLQNSSNSGGNALLGWTQDGMPLSATVAGFSSAFERALVEAISTSSREASPPLNEEHMGRASESATGVAQDIADNAEQPEGVASEAQGNEEPQEIAQAQNVGSDVSVPNDDAANSPAAAGNSTRADTTSHDATGNGGAPDGATGNSSNSIGDGVASSLAASLRLSPRSESSAQSDQMSSTEVQAQTNVTTDQETQAATGPEDGSNSAPTEEQGENESNMDNSNPENVADASQGGLVCPPGMDLEVFNSLPVEMQREVVAEHQSAADVAAQLDPASGLDPEALAALPEDMRREVIEQEQRERRGREQAPADPSHAEEMDNASFIASLAPDLREEILLTADEAFLNSLPPNIIAEAQILRERASVQNRRHHDDALLANGGNRDEGAGRSNDPRVRNVGSGATHSSRRRIRTGKIKVETDKAEVLYLPKGGVEGLSSPIGSSDLEALLRLLYLLSPVRPPKLLQKVFQNISAVPTIRSTVWTAFVMLLNDDGDGAVSALRSLRKHYTDENDWRRKMDEEFRSDDTFPPGSLIGTAPEVLDTESLNPNFNLFRRRQGGSTAASIAANLPASARGSSEQYMPPVVATRMIDTLSQLSKSSPRACLDALAGTFQHQNESFSCLDVLLDLLEKPRYSNSSTSLEQLLALIETLVAPLSLLPSDGQEEHEVSQAEIDSALSVGKELIDVPRIVVSQRRLELLCSILRMEGCKDAAFTKVNAIARRLCRVEANRGFILAELASVAQSLGLDAIRDLRTLHIRMNDAVLLHRDKLVEASSDSGTASDAQATQPRLVSGTTPSSSVTLSTSTSELKLLRVLQTLQSLCMDHSQDDQNSRKNEGNVIVTQDLVDILQRMELDDLWSQLTACLKMVKVLEGVTTLQDLEESETGENNEADDASGDGNGKTLQNSVAGLLTRFLPIIEAFFVVNASTTRQEDGDRKGGTESSPDKKSAEDGDIAALVDGRRVVDFVTTNRMLLNALVRNNPSLLEKGLRAMVQVSRCRVLLDFDVKRQWFKTQVRRLRQHASRRHGSLRLVIRRENVFEDAYHQLRLRNADEMRGRLHITFRNEEGVDAGGLSREFFGILAKEIFNPNYALFTSTEDGCTFQPNPNSSINPDHLSYFRFVGRIVGKAVADGFLLDAHFTRSLYKHMLGVKPTHHDMEAIDPDYYKNLKMILEYNLADIGLDLTFSIEDHSFGRSQVIDLRPNGRNIHVTEETKAEYVSLVCQHRMTTAISSQIKAYLDGFYELVSKDLIAIFTPKELELLISGLPDIDVLDLKQHTDYQGYKAADKEIQWFWNILFSLSRSEKAAFLQFVTGSSKVPLSGFAELQGMRGVQKFSIHRVGGSSGALMSAHTCFNSLDLPQYKSEDEMREKLLYAISEGGGAFMFA